MKKGTLCFHLDFENFGPRRNTLNVVAMKVNTKPYGQWESPITARALSYNSVSLNAPRSSVSSSQSISVLRMKVFGEFSRLM